MNKIPFNKPFFTGKETNYIEQAVASGKISGDGDFSKRCERIFEQKYKFSRCLLTSSCTDALEMTAILADIQPGDEVIMPSYTFVSTANAFVLRGAKIIFADSREDNPNIDEETIENLISDKTKAIVVVHYAGIACEMDSIIKLARKHHLLVIEDAAHAIDSYYKNRPLGSMGHLAAFSFHETKNIIAGEGGMLVINDQNLIKRAEIIREKGTNRAAFFRGEIDKYNWVDIGSSYLPSEITAAFLYAQIENISKIQNKRKWIWEFYNNKLSPLSNFGVQLPQIPPYATNNGHLFYLVCNNNQERTALIKYLNENNIYAVFHYQSLHKSPYYHSIYGKQKLTNSDLYSEQLVRLPLFYELQESDLNRITSSILSFYEHQKISLTEKVKTNIIEARS